jgi:DNA-binding SARP family transcriptional activator/pimeloyl-ACP methyl ester carboxylesterase
MDFRILGPLEVRDGDRDVPLRGGKERALLALLLVNVNRTLALDRIVDSLWGEDVPETAQKMVQVHVSRLRKVLEPQTIRTRPPGYALVLRPEQVDLHRFETSVGEAREALDAGQARQAAGRFREALSLWRGPALAELTSEPFAESERARLENLRMYALEGLLEAELESGHHRAAVGELEALIAEHPLRERLRWQHMLALYRSGRHAEALTSYQTYRQTLSEELGIEPSASLRDLERQILRQDPALELQARAETHTSAAGSAATSVGGAPPDEVAYARSGDVRIAYQVVGDGPVDLVLVHGWVCTFQPGWEYPKVAGFYERLASMGRLILFDKRGTGLSDRVSPERLPDLETRMDDVRAVLDAVGSERAVLLGLSEGGAMSTLFAATHPERTAALILMGTFPREMQDTDYRWGVTEENLQRRLSLLDEDDWASAATRDWLGRVAPAILRDPETLAWYTSYVRRGASPGAARALRLMNTQIDVRNVLGTISVPTLVLHRAHETWREGSRYMGEHIPGALMVELAGHDHLPWEGDSPSLLEQIERFLASLREEVEPDRVLATILFADVASTSTTAGPGNGVGRRLLPKHRGLVQARLARFRGREVDTRDDGISATFDGPARAIRCASAIAGDLKALGVDVRSGVHTGEVEQVEGHPRGIAVDIARQVAATAQPGEVAVSSTVKDIVAGSGIAFEERGDRELEGVPGTWRLYAAHI